MLVIPTLCFIVFYYIYSNHLPFSDNRKLFSVISKSDGDVCLQCRVPCSKNSYTRSTNSTPFPTPATVSVFSLYKMYEQLSRKSSSTSTFQISPDSSRPESSSSRGPPPPSPLVASANISSLQYFTARPSLPHTPDYLDMDQ